MKQPIGYNSVIRNNSSCITYAYDILNEQGIVTKGNVQESFVLLPTDMALIAANNLILGAINLRLNPVVVPVLGHIKIKYVDSEGIDLEVPTELKSLPLATYYYTAKSFVGYNLIGNSVNSIILTDDIPQVITFTYSKILKGNITLKYQCNSVDLEIPTLNSDLDLGSYTYNNKVFEGYIVNEGTSKSTILSADNLNPTITFLYTKAVIVPVTGSVILTYLDETRTNIEEPTIINNLDIGTYDYVNKTFEGYELNDDLNKTAVLTIDNLNQTITFLYTKIVTK